MEELDGREQSDTARALDRNSAIDIRVQKILAPRLAGGRTAGFVDSGGLGVTVSKEFFALEELLRDGGDVAPRAEIFRSIVVCQAEATISWDPLELPSEEFPCTIIPRSLVHGAKQPFSPSAANGRQGEVMGKGHRFPKCRTDLTGRHEIRKTGKERLVFLLVFHDFMFFC